MTLRLFAAALALGLALPIGGARADATSNLGITPLTSSQAQKEITTNEAIERVAGAAAQRCSIAMSDATTTPTAAQVLPCATLELTGALTGDRNLVVPTVNHPWTVKNGTTGSHAVTVKTASGAGIAIANGAEQIVRADGTNVVAVTAGSSGGAVGVAGGGTGAITLTAHGLLIGEGTSAVSAVAAMSSGQIVVGQGTSADPAAETMSGDCTLASSGAIACTKTNTVSFAASATTDTTSASNISAGTLAAARGGAGTVSGALKGNGSGVVSQAACADLSNGATGCSTATGTSGATIPLNNGRNSWSAGQVGVPVTVAISTATFTPDLALGNNFSITLVHASCPCTLANPTNIVAGQSGQIVVNQSATGSDLISSYGGDWKFSGGTAPTLSTGASAIDILSYYVIDATHIAVSSTANFQ